MENPKRWKKSKGDREKMKQNICSINESLNEVVHVAPLLSVLYYDYFSCFNFINHFKKMLILIII